MRRVLLALLLLGTSASAQWVMSAGNATPPSGGPTATLSANPISITSGQSSTLTWTSSNATTVTLNGTAVALSGTQTVSPATTTSYTLVASGATGTNPYTVSATVSVGAAPPAGVPWAGILDTSRATDWRTAGIPGGIPNITTQCGQTVVPSGIPGWTPATVYAANSRVSDRNGNLQLTVAGGTSGTYPPLSNGETGYPAWSTTGNTTETSGTNMVWALQSTTSGTDTLNVNGAITACGTDQFVLLGPGTFVATNGITISQSHVVLRGSGPKVTKLKFTNGGPCSAVAYLCMGNLGIFITYNANYPCAADWTGGFAQGSTVLTIATPTGNLAPGAGGAPCSGTLTTNADAQVGNIIYLDQREDGIGICPPSGGTGDCTGQVGAHAVGTLATIVTSIPHGFQVGQSVGVGEVRGTDCTGVNGSANTANGTSCFNSQSNTAGSQLQAYLNHTTPSPCGAASPNQSGCAPWVITAVGCVVSGVFSSATSCSNTNSDPSRAGQPNAFQYQTAFPPAADSGWGFAGVDNFGMWMFGANEVTFWGAQQASRFCDKSAAISSGTPTSGTNNTAVGGAGDAQCAVGELSRKDPFEVHQITACTPNCTNPTSITITPPIMHPMFRASQRPGLWWGYRIRRVGLENLTIDGGALQQPINVAPSVGSQNVVISNCTECWVRNTRMLWGGRDQIIISGSFHTEIRDNYFFASKHGQSTSYGIETGSTDGSELVVNNIAHVAATFFMSQGDYGDAWAYNFVVGSNYYPYYSFASGGVCNHNWSGYRIFEGNVSGGLNCDNNHGSLSPVTMFRNRWRGIDYPDRFSSNGRVILIDSPFQRGLNIIGNIFGWPGSAYYTTYQKLGRPPQGGTNVIFYLGGGATRVPDDPVIPQSVFRWGNYDTTTGGTRWCATGNEGAACSCGSPAAIGCTATSELSLAMPYFGVTTPANQALPASMIFSSPPAFWNTTWGTPGWPAIGPDVNASGSPLNGTCTPNDIYNPLCDGVGNYSYSIPAQLCFANTPIDPASGYEQKFNVVQAVFSPAAPWGGSGTVDLTVDTLGNLGKTGVRIAGAITVSGVTPAGYNGLHTVAAVCGNTTLHASSVECGTWQASGYYNVGAQIVDSNGNVQTVSAASGNQRAGTTQPIWPTTLNQTVVDNGQLTWQLTQIGGPAPLPVLRYYLPPGKGDPGGIGSGGTVELPGIRLFDARDCYPNEPLSLSSSNVPGRKIRKQIRRKRRRGGRQEERQEERHEDRP